MQAQAPNMNATTQIIMSAAICGTAEALGGGKFANGAVTGAYVMMFNHMGGRWHSSGKKLPPEDFYFNDDVFEVEGDGSYVLWDNKWLRIPENGGTITYRDGWDLSYETPEITISGIQQAKWDYTTSLIRQESAVGATWGGGFFGGFSTASSLVKWGLKGFKLTTLPATLIGAGIGYSVKQFDVSQQMHLRMMDHDANVIKLRNYNLNNN